MQQCSRAFQLRQPRSCKLGQREINDRQANSCRRVIVDCEKSELSLEHSNESCSRAIVLTETDDPIGPCPDCGSGQWWHLPAQAWHCRACEPDMPLTATTLTSGHCHKECVAPVGSHADLKQMIEVKCERRPITLEQLRQELKDDLESCDQLTADVLRLMAETLSTINYHQNRYRMPTVCLARCARCGGWVEIKHSDYDEITDTYDWLCGCGNVVKVCGKNVRAWSSDTPLAPSAEPS